MRRTSHIVALFSACTLAAVVIAQTQPSATAAATARAATNPFTAPAQPAPAVPNARDQQSFTNDRTAGLNPALPTLFIAGDSTAATGDIVHRGWAAVLVDYFDTSKVNFCNRGVGGARFNTYLPTWNQLLAAVKPGDFVVIQFGHNSGPLAGVSDETAAAPAPAGRGNRGGAATATSTASAPAATLLHTHGWYLNKFINDVRDKKATPIAMTLRDLWKDGKVERLKKLVVTDTTGMSDWTRQVAASDKCLLIDHSNIIGDIYDKLGETDTDKLFGDHYLHTNTAGAIINCEAFVAGLKAVPHMPLVGYLNEKGTAVPAYKAAIQQNP